MTLDRHDAPHGPPAEPGILMAIRADEEQLADRFRRDGRIHMPDFFTPAAAERIHKCLAEETPWYYMYNAGAQPVNLSGAQWEGLSPKERRDLVDRIQSNARKGFQYFYDNFNFGLAPIRADFPSLYLNSLFDFLNGPPMLALIRQVTGFPTISRADAHATLYRPGHFLTSHNDEKEGAKRLAAYVLNFTPHWRADWGGVLQFLDEDGHVSSGYVPCFNALNLFRVPQDHAVSYVSPFAGGYRYSVTGWFMEE